MAWFMFKESESYQYKGKKCDGFPNKANQPHINLSWGMDNPNYLQRQPNHTKNNDNNLYANTTDRNEKNDKNNLYEIPISDKLKSSSLLPAMYEKRSDQEQLEKIMKSYDKKRIGQAKEMRVLQQNQYGYSSEKPVTGKVYRSDTQQSAERIRVLQNSLLPLNSPPSLIHRRDTMGLIISPDKRTDYQMAQSRVSRRSTSGNKKNQSRVVFGDGIYNSFLERQERKKNFHEHLLEMYDYEDKKKDRKISQIAL